MPFINETIEVSTAQHIAPQTIVDSSKTDPFTTLYFLLTLLVVYLFRGVIVMSLVVIFNLSILGLFGFLTYKMILT
jgi:hypothetical protein